MFEVKLNMRVHKIRLITRKTELYSKTPTWTFMNRSIHLTNTMFSYLCLYYEKGTFLVFTARKRSLRRLCFYRCMSVHKGVCYPSMHCIWYPSMPCSRSPWGCTIPACIAGFHAHTQGGSLGGSGWGVSRPTPKGEV